MNEVTALIPNWNGERFLARILENLGQQSRPPAEVLVVDNGSVDGSRQTAQRLGAELLALPANAGFAAAVNRGLERCRKPLVALLNNDVELDREWLARLVDGLAGPEGGKFYFATGKIYQAKQPNLLDGTLDAVSRAACAWRCGHGRPDGDIWSRPSPVFFAPMTAVLYRREIFDMIGGLDERFESYLEDMYFGLRCALAGTGGVYVPGALAWHWGSGTLGMWHPETVRKIARNQIYLVAKHYPKKWFRDLGWPVLAGQLLWGLLAFRHGRGLSYLRGKLEGLRGFHSMRGGEVKAAPVRQLLIDSEDIIRNLQSRTGFDWYWKLYFALT